MQVLLSCTECEYEEWGTEEGQLMNKIIVWNHIQKEHPATAARVMRVYQHVPSSLFHVRVPHKAANKQKLSPKYA